MVPPPTDSDTTPSFIVSVIPFLAATVPFAVLFFAMARRKEKNPLLWLFLGFIPIVNLVAGYWLASQTDDSVKDQIKRLRDEIIQLKEKK